MSVDRHKGRRLRVVLGWHMHQPEYRCGRSQEYQLPWTYLHAIKDYTDMAAHLEANPEARAVVNFAPVLLDQLADYAQQLHSFLNNAGEIRDPLLAALGTATLPDRPEPRRELIFACLRANEQRLIQRFQAYQELVDLASWGRTHAHSLIYLNDQYLADLLVWYHLAWLGETIRREDPRVVTLMEKERGYGLQDRYLLMTVIAELISGLIGRYRKLAEAGRIELSVTPYAHPILPLLLDFNSAREAWPEISLPEGGGYPGGQERVAWHIERGLRTFEAHFGFRPQGCWPSEGSVSEATLEVLHHAGFRWAATGGVVLRNSLTRAHQRYPKGSKRCLHRPYQVGAIPLWCFSRDDGLSDMIGFNYAEWHAEDAVTNLLHHLDNIADACADAPGPVASVILDGENAWESYPENAFHFLRRLYQGLAEHPRIELSTFSQCIRDTRIQPAKLSGLVAGSWVHGTFSTWIGDPDKNRAWEMLLDAKRAFDQALNNGALQDKQRHLVERQLAICEGSDWFWWFGDYNPGETVAQFDRLYRHQLAYLYELMRIEPPEYLAHEFTHGGGQPLVSGVMRRSY